MIKMYKQIMNESRNEFKRKVGKMIRDTAEAEWTEYFLRNTDFEIERTMPYRYVPYMQLFDERYNNGQDINQLTIDCIRALYSVGGMQEFMCYALYDLDPYRHMKIKFAKGHRDPEDVAKEALNSLNDMLANKYATANGYTVVYSESVSFRRLSYHWKTNQASLKKDIVRYIKSVWNNRAIKEFAPLYKIHEPELYKRCAR